MANAIYPKYKEIILGAATNANLLTGTVRAALVDTGTYTYNAAHEFLTSLTGVVGTAQTIGATKSVTNGLFDGGDVTYTGLPVTPNGGDISIQWNASGIFQL